MLASAPFAGFPEETRSGKKAVEVSQLLNCADFEAAARGRLSHLAF
jgi:hypothetical protein